MMATNFEYYKVFYYVAQYGNITRAADKLCLTQPSVTRAIHNLEDQLGCRLFNRTSKGVVLTKEGTIIYQQVRKGCEALFEAEEELERLKNLGNGTIRIVANEIASKLVVIPAMKKFKKDHPSIVFNIMKAKAYDSVELMNQGKVDFAIDLVEVDENGCMLENTKMPSIPSNIELGKIYEDVPLVGETYKEYAKRKVDISELAVLPLINKGTRYTGYQRLLRPEGKFRPADMEVSAFESRILLAELGMGITFAPAEAVTKEISEGRLFPIELKNNPLHLRLRFFTSTFCKPGLAAQKFLKLLQNEEGSGLYGL